MTQGFWSQQYISFAPPPPIPVILVDSIPPSNIVDLVATAIGVDEINLEWTAPGDDGAVGTADQYDIRYSESMITPANFNTQAQWPTPPVPQIAGSLESVVITGLTEDRTYYFAIKTADEVPNWSDISNVSSAKTFDLTAPNAISDLAVVNPQPNQVTLTFTAPYDTNGSGDVVSYDIRYSESAITIANFSSAEPFPAPAPQSGGSAESIDITGLDPATLYYFAIKSTDDEPLTSPISNLPSGSTTSEYPVEEFLICQLIGMARPIRLF